MTSKFRKLLSKVKNPFWKTGGELITEIMDGRNLVNGKQTFELARTHKDDLPVMIKCCEAEIIKFKKTHLVPAPFYFERVAILSRKNKNYKQEIDYCEKYIRFVDLYCKKNKTHENVGVKMGPRYKAIVNRLPKAKELYKQQRS